MEKKAPKYSLHKATSQAKVRIDGEDIYLGPYGSAESREAYDAVVAKWLADCEEPCSQIVTLARLAILYVDFARGYYREDGEETGEVYCIQLALKPLVRKFGRERARTLGPRKLKIVRDEMIRMGWARTTINHAIQRITRMLRWAAENELAAASVYQACRAMTGLRRGRSEARETEPVRPVPQEDVDAVELYVSKQVWAMIQLQLCTGMRPGEVCMMRACDINQSKEVWEYRPQTHKTAHHGRERLIFIGPRAREILQPYLEAATNGGYLFRPDAAELNRNALRRAGRKSPMTPSQAVRTRKENPLRTPGERYDRTSFTRSIARACKLANVTSWSPNRLRHNAATELRKKFGLEGTRTVLGHSNADMTQVYAEIDFEAAREIMRSAG